MTQQEREVLTRTATVLKLVNDALLVISLAGAEGNQNPISAVKVVWESIVPMFQEIMALYKGQGQQMQAEIEMLKDMAAR